MTMFRKLILRIFQHVNPGDIKIRHHYTGQLFQLHSFKHKGYWYYGARRELATMRLFARLITAGETVIEIGGHIGYITMYLSHLVGEDGNVIVFEPGVNNLRYIQSNLEQCNNVELISQAVSDTDGTATFFLEELTGQNNTLVKDYEVFFANQQKSGTQESYVPVTVETTRLDSFLAQREIKPDFVKIDVEGAESQVLLGASITLRIQRPMLMLEVTQDHDHVVSILTNLGYILFTPTLEKYDGSNSDNVFAFHREKHANLLEDILVDSRH